MKRLDIPGKWIRTVHSTTPMTTAVRQVLKLRLKAIELLLPLAADQHETDVEYIHQLRVATRRADASLRLFKPCLARSHRRKTRAQLREIRRAAGAARECDVHLGLFRSTLNDCPDHRRELLLGLIDDTAAQREHAQQRVRETATRYPVAKLRKQRKRLLRRIRTAKCRHESSPEIFADLAAHGLRPVLSGVEVAGQRDLGIIDNLHQLRIASKRLRYALEVFSPCFGEGFSALYKRIESIQDILGEINDDAELQSRVIVFAADHTGLRAEAGSLIAEIEGRLQHRISSFRQDWDGGAWSDIASIGDRVMMMLSSPPDEACD